MRLKFLENDKECRFILLALATITFVIPFCNLIFSEGSLFYFSAYTVSIIGKYLTFALLALSLDLVWGYCGILALGQGVFFGLGGYAIGMYLMRQIGTRGVYADPLLPDFMVFLSWKE